MPTPKPVRVTARAQGKARVQAILARRRQSNASAAPLTDAERDELLLALADAILDK